MKTELESMSGLENRAGQSTSFSSSEVHTPFGFRTLSFSSL